VRNDDQERMLRRYGFRPPAPPQPSKQPCPVCRAAGVTGTKCRTPELHQGQAALRPHQAPS
jgi:hypothetical protein